MPARLVASFLSKTQRDFLIDHVVNGFRTINHSEDPTRNALVAKSLLRYENQQFTSRPKTTVLTERGREVVCIVLGQYADALVRCGCLEKAPDIEPMLQALMMEQFKSDLALQVE